VSGHSHLLGRNDLVINGSGYTPLSRRLWLVADHPVRLLALETPMVPEARQLREGLHRLHELALAVLDGYVRQVVEQEQSRILARGTAHQRVMADATHELTSTMDVSPTREKTVGPTGARQVGAVTTWDDALIVASRRAGEAMGISMRAYPTGEGTSTPRDPIAAIARASGVRVRQVALRDAWWLSEHGPLLGRTEQDNHPVAIIPADKGGYYAVDPLDGRTFAITEESAATIAPMAHTFYRPLPETAITLKTLMRFGLQDSRGDLLIVLAIALAGALLGLVPAMVMRSYFNDVVPSADRQQLWQLTALLVTCAIAGALFNLTRAAALLRIETRLSHSIQSAVWDRLLSLPIGFFRQYAAGDLAVRAMNIDAIRQVVSGTTVTAILSGVFSLMNLILMFKYSSKLAWWGLGAMACAIAVTAVGGLIQLHHSRGVQEVYARTSGLVLQLLSSVTKLRIAGAEPQAFRLWAGRFGDQRRLQFRVRRIAVMVSTINSMLPILANALLFWAAVPLLDAATTPLKTGDFLAFLAAFGGCQAALVGACAALLGTLQAVPLYEQAKPILVTPPEVDGSKVDPGTLNGAIDIQHAVFRYAADGPQVIRDLSVHIEPGEFVAFVGPSGSGKSTLFRLLLGFESLESGSIYFDGQDLSGLDVRAVRRQIGVVLQNGRLMAGDLFTNIAGASAATLDDAWDAATMAGLAEDIRSMPMGMHTVLSDGGGSLSGGQRQRLLIARAIVQRPRILLFDEATSALDNHTQAVVRESLSRLNATRIVVAHRLSTIEHADRIVVIEKGRVAQQGRYAELIGQPGPFAELAARQLT
jgi:NHLM bacteriocin system ABC transporter ATP-binding protein